MARPAAISDLRRRAKRRLPRIVFDFMEGGAGDESCLRRNRQAFRDAILLPHYLVDVSARSLRKTLFGQEFSAPFGLAPVGLGNLIWPHAEQRAAAAAAAARIPFVLSTAASTTIEEIAEIAGGYTWFQLYPSTSDRITRDLLARAEAAGVTVLMVTVDIPVAGKRNRDLRNGFTLPLRPGVREMLDVLMHPGWLAATLNRGMPTFANLTPYAGKGAGTGAQSLAAFMSAQISDQFDWEAFGRLRRAWRGRLLVKGLLHPDDAKRAVLEGADGIVVSNHGGRQLDAAPGTLHQLPLIREATGTNCTILLDSGIRSGSDIVKALAAGADFVLFGRPWLYGAAAGVDGIETVIAILEDETKRTLGQLGCRHIEDLNKLHVSRERS